ncbi:hypothetical protein SEPL_528 [Salmonella phage SE_PL]|uniref:hypothetical protein n=1 Tax=Salmonella enterica TaxID=28901 RepID=UPI000FDFA456|nr:hypothetical protein CPT_Munch_432 [Salmonella phage Munch]EAZ2022714.1 hypothetical protein [Salmonella enterica]ECV9083848.1 hypothetical protein [Salmonella enterica subsp. enterica serovar Infantis]MCP0435556.1 hypothetical protein [Salmonella enterica subsp. enterica serovar Mbandaka]QCW18539.1 hypothetical protein 7t3_06 [Salmonella phage 7t3]QIG63141.1 hypothetical protein SEPL_528 [Salmonella phage SE_PL]WNV47527.1 hypothetical protein [Klebsiella phage fENko-Kae01]
MTNQDYMDMLEKYALSTDENNKLVLTIDENCSITIQVFTKDFYLDTGNPFDGGMQEYPIITILDGELLMPLPNIMDALIKKTSRRNITFIMRGNAEIMSAQGKEKNQTSSSELRIPYYENEDERFQAELLGEIVLYETHLKYIDSLVQKAHDNYKQMMQKTWDNRIIL